jgi:hypothetical protein
MELSFRRLLKWIELCRLKLEYAHTSGHMHEKDIERLVSEIEHPELFTQWSRNIHIPHIGEILEL